MNNHIFEEYTNTNNKYWNYFECKNCKLCKAISIIDKNIYYCFNRDFKIKNILTDALTDAILKLSCGECLMKQIIE